MGTGGTAARPAIGSGVYPTRIRTCGTGLASMCARAGGLLGVGVAVVDIAPPSLRGLVEITAVELRKALEAR